MSSNGTLTYFDKKNNIFKTVFIHHIEHNYSNYIDSLELLNKYYKDPEKARELVENGFLSYFNKKKIIKCSDEIAINSCSIKELKELTLSWTSYNYVYFLGHWYKNPIDVENIYYSDYGFENHFEEEDYYNLLIKTYNYFISKPSKSQNINVSKVAIIEKDNQPILVLCMSRKDILAASAGNQISEIYESLVKTNPLLKKAKWYNFEPLTIKTFLDYMLLKVNFDENNSPTWEKNIFWNDITKYYNIEGFEDLLKSISTK